MENDRLPAYDDDLERPPRVESTWRERRARRRALRRAETRARLEAGRRHHTELGEQAERARQPFGGPLRVDLRGGGDLSWVWLDADDARANLAHAPTLCVGECTLHLRPGSYRFGLRNVSLSGTASVPVRIDASGVLTADYDPGVVRRRAGKALIVLGASTLAGVLVSAFMRDVAACGLFPEEGVECTGPGAREVALGAPIGAVILGAGVTLVLTARPRLDLSFRRRVPPVDAAW